jgi:hypothetical protein
MVGRPLDHTRPTYQQHLPMTDTAFLCFNLSSDAHSFATIEKRHG